MIWWAMSGNGVMTGMKVPMVNSIENGASNRIETRATGFITIPSSLTLSRVKGWL
jgi:hypothetical protein